MVGYANNKPQKSNIKNFCAIILRDCADHPRILKRMKLTADIIKRAGAKVEFVDIKEGSLMFKIFSALLLGDWTSYFLALKCKIDPTPVKTVEEFKKLMQK